VRLGFLLVASGFIYLIILGMWAAYFLPKWISSHEDASGKTQERYRSAMRIVSETGIGAPIADASKQISREEKHRQIAQRRIVFGSLLATLIISLALVAGSFISAPILLVPISAIAIYTVQVRRQLASTQALARRVAALEKITSAEVITEPIERTILPKYEPEVLFNEVQEHWVPLSERQDISGVVILPKGTVTPTSTWQPVNIPAPTYVYAPKAVSGKRVIDLTVPGAWLEQQREAERVAQFEREQSALNVPSRDELFDQELEAQAAHRHDRAVNE
jgi:hypothetical protein